MMLDRAKAYREAVNMVAAKATDADALSASILYPVWAEGVDVKLGDRMRGKSDGKLYKCTQAHTSQEDWQPEETASLWTRVDVTHAGTADDPIPYDGNMALESGKYYMQDGVTYLCIRDTGNPVYHTLDELVGLYVEKA